LNAEVSVGRLSDEPRPSTQKCDEQVQSQVIDDCDPWTEETDETDLMKNT
jgi:hypothetical protein